MKHWGLWNTAAIDYGSGWKILGIHTKVWSACGRPAPAHFTIWIQWKNESNSLYAVTI